MEEDRKYLLENEFDMKAWNSRFDCKFEDKDPPHKWAVDSFNCWDECGKKGGSCDRCKGYCCSATRTDKNGDCPAEAVNYLAQNYNQDHHQCIAPVSFDGKKKVLLSYFYCTKNSFIQYR